MKGKSTEITDISELFAVMPQETASFFHVGTVLPVLLVEQGNEHQPYYQTCYSPP